MLGFWYGLCNTSHSESSKISNLMFQLCSKSYYACDYKLPWLMKVHSLLNSLGLTCIWSNQVHTIESFKRIVKQRQRDQFIPERHVIIVYLKRNFALRNIQPISHLP